MNKTIDEHNGSHDDKKKKLNYLNDKIIRQIYIKVINNLIGSLSQSLENAGQKEYKVNLKQDQQQQQQKKSIDLEIDDIPLITHRLSIQYTQHFDQHELNQDDIDSILNQKKIYEQFLQTMELTRTSLNVPINSLVFAELIQRCTFSQIQIKFIKDFIFQFSIFKNNQQLKHNSEEIDIKFLLKHVKLETFQKRETIFDYGDLGSKYYMLLKGSVMLLIPKRIENEDQNIIEKLNISSQDDQYYRKIYPDMFTKKIILPGESFGEISLLTNQTRTATMICGEDSWLLTLDKEGFDKLISQIHQQAVQQNTNFLYQFEMIQGLSQNKIYSLLHNIQIQKYHYNNIIYNEDQEADTIYFIKNGLVEISKLSPLFDSKIILNNKVDYDQNKSGDINLSSNENSPLSTKEISLYKLNMKNKHNEKLTKFKRVKLTILPENTFFGHQEINSINPDVRKYQAKCISEEVELLTVKKEILLSYLRTSPKGIDILMKTLQKQMEWKDQIINDQLQILSLIKSPENLNLSQYPAHNNSININYQKQSSDLSPKSPQKFNYQELTPQQKRNAYQSIGTSKSQFSNFHSTQTNFQFNQHELDISNCEPITDYFTFNQNNLQKNEASNCLTSNLTLRKKSSKTQDINETNIQSPLSPKKNILQMLEMKESYKNKKKLTCSIHSLDQKGNLFDRSSFIHKNKIERTKTFSTDQRENESLNHMEISTISNNNFQTNNQQNLITLQSRDTKIFKKRNQLSKKGQEAVSIQKLFTNQDNEYLQTQLSENPASFSKKGYQNNLIKQQSVPIMIHLNNDAQNTQQQLTSRNNQTDKSEINKTEEFQYLTSNKDIQTKINFFSQNEGSSPLNQRKFKPQQFSQQPQKIQLEQSQLTQKLGESPKLKNIYDQFSDIPPQSNLNINHRKFTYSDEEISKLSSTKNPIKQNFYYLSSNFPIKTEQTNYSPNMSKIFNSLHMSEQNNSASYNEDANQSHLQQLTCDFKQHYIKNLNLKTQQKEEILNAISKQNPSQNRQGLFFDTNKEKKSNYSKKQNFGSQFTSVKHKLSLSPSRQLNNQQTSQNSSKMTLPIKIQDNNSEDLQPESQKNPQIISDLIVKNIKNNIIKHRKIMFHAYQNSNSQQPVNSKSIQADNQSQNQILMNEMQSNQQAKQSLMLKFPLLSNSNSPSKQKFSSLTNRQILQQLDFVQHIIQQKEPISKSPR